MRLTGIQLGAILSGELVRELPDDGFADFVEQLLSVGPQSATGAIEAWQQKRGQIRRAYLSCFAALAHAVFCRLNCKVILDTPERAAAWANLGTARGLDAAGWAALDSIEFHL